jgi:hypothetical protein
MQKIGEEMQKNAPQANLAGTNEEAAKRRDETYRDAEAGDSDEKTN